MHIFQRNKQKGFTLIELLVVIAIIGILATIVLVSLNTARQKARDARRVGDLRQIALALELYYDDKVAYPTSTTWALLQTCLEGGGGVGCTGAVSYMSDVPNDPSGGAATYSYGQSGAQDYVLASTLENTSNPVLANDVDALTFGVACADPAYCIQP